MSAARDAERGGERDAVVAFVGMGSNVGDRAARLRAAVAGLAAAEGVVVEAVSPVYETEAHVRPDQPPQPDHLNAVACLRTTLAPEALLARCQALERAAGRDPAAPPWSPRPLDLDLLLYGEAPVALEGAAPLVVPHPRLPERRFVLAPLADLAPGLVVPGLHLNGQPATVAALLAATPDVKAVRRTGLRLSAD